MIRGKVLSLLMVSSLSCILCTSLSGSQSVRVLLNWVPWGFTFHLSCSAFSKLQGDDDDEIIRLFVQINLNAIYYQLTGLRLAGNLNVPFVVGLLLSYYLLFKCVRDTRLQLLRIQGGNKVNGIDLSTISAPQ